MKSSYRKESEMEAVGIAIAGAVCTSISGLQQLQHPSIWSLIYDMSCICNGPTPEALHVEQKAMYEHMRLGDGKLCSTTRCKSISWSPTLADNREVLEYRYAAKLHLVHSMWSNHKGDIERGMLKQRPTLDITRSNQYQIRAQADKIKSHCTQSARNTIP